jgi:hypothetical protein
MLQHGLMLDIEISPYGRTQFQGATDRGRVSDTPFMASWYEDTGTEASSSSILSTPRATVKKRLRREPLSIHTRLDNTGPPRENIPATRRKTGAISIQTAYIIFVSNPTLFSFLLLLLELVIPPLTGWVAWW